MKKELVHFVENIREGYVRNQPEILTGLGLIGLAMSVHQAYKAAPRVQSILEEQRRKMSNIHSENKIKKREITMDTCKRVGVVMLPTVLSTGFSAGCIIGANRASNKRIVALSAAYSISESTVKNLNKKMEEVLGEKKVQTIKESISGDKLKEDVSTPQENQIILTNGGDVLCKDLYTGRYFRSSAQKIGQSINTLSSRIRHEMYVSLNDFYILLDIPPIPVGDDLGWNIDDLLDGNLPITYSAQLTNDYQPCLCVEYDAAIRADFRKLY